MTDVEYELLAARFSDDGIYGDPSDTAVVSAGTGLSVNVRAGVTGSLRGHGWMSGTSTVTLPVDANSSGATRRDLVVLRLDRSDWTVRAAVKTGGPWLPSPTQDTGDTGVYEIPLAEVTVLSGASSVTVTRGELYVGGRFRPCTSTTRDPAPRVGDGCVETDTGRVRVWNGSSWGVVYSNSGVVDISSPLSAWEITTGSILEERNGNVHLRLGSFTRAAGSLSGPTESRLPILIPAAYRHPNRDHYTICYITGARIGRLTIFSAASDRPGQVWLTQHPTMATGDALLNSGSSWVV
ncbi:hypothetical protein [Streptomyces sp.]|uniref:hypothetical protein n=1 Tax=Streptomyces sp. TaxID=1931 RepID=UPI0028114AC6|nr:hypothetical protein [Streptomyces sp.]